MNVQFVGDAHLLGGVEALEVDMRIDGSPATCIVTAAAIRELSHDRIDADNVARVFRQKESLFRDVITEMTSGSPMPDRVVIDACDVRGRES